MPEARTETYRWEVQFMTAIGGDWLPTSVNRPDYESARAELLRMRQESPSTRLRLLSVRIIREEGIEEVFEPLREVVA